MLGMLLVEIGKVKSAKVKQLHLDQSELHNNSFIINTFKAMTYRDISFRMEQWGYNPKSKNDCELFKKELRDILKTLQ